MNLHELSPAAGSTHVGKRKGRGIGTGNGKTAGRGHKGQWARSGGGVRIGFEGGQMPLARRLPKRGFNNIFAKRLEAVNVSALNKFEDGAVVNVCDLLEKGIISKCEYGVKILGNGEITKKLTVRAHAFSAGAKEKIEKAGGKAEKIEVVKQETVNVSALKKFEDGATVNVSDLQEKGILSQAEHGVKILGRGEMTKKLTVRASAFSANAKEKIKKAGGTAEVI